MRANSTDAPLAQCAVLAATEIPPLARPRRTRVKAREEQHNVQAWETALLDLARVHHPTVAWWHGYRRAEDRYGSYCYVCERFIATWMALAGIPDAAKDSVESHKWEHHRTALATASRRNK